MVIALSSPPLPEAFVENHSDDDSFIDLWAAVAASKRPAENCSTDKMTSLPGYESKPKDASLDQALSYPRSKSVPKHCPVDDALGLSESEEAFQCITTNDNNGCQKVGGADSLSTDKASRALQLHSGNLTTAGLGNSGNNSLRRNSEGSQSSPHQQICADVDHQRDGLEQVVTTSRRVHRRHSVSAIECAEQSSQNSTSDLNRCNQMKTQTSSSRVYPRPKNTSATMDDGVIEWKDCRDTIVHKHGSSRSGAHRRYSMSTVECTAQGSQNLKSDLNRRKGLRRKSLPSSVCPPKTTYTTLDDDAARMDRHDTIVNHYGLSRRGAHRRHSMSTVECMEPSQNTTNDLNRRDGLRRKKCSSSVCPPKTTSITTDDTAGKDRHDTIVHQYGFSRKDVHRRYSTSAIECKTQNKTQMFCTTPRVLNRQAGLHSRTQSSCRSRSTTMEVSIMRGDQLDTTLHTHGLSKRGAHRRNSMSDIECETHNLLCTTPCFRERHDGLQHTKHIPSNYASRTNGP
jgi:hypothetical protein